MPSEYATWAKRRRSRSPSISATAEALRDADEEEIQRVPDVGPVVAKNIRAYFESAENRTLLKRLLASGIRWPKLEQAPATGGFAGKTFVLTGTLAHMTREAARDAILSAAAR